MFCPASRIVTFISWAVLSASRASIWKPQAIPPTSRIACANMPRTIRVIPGFSDAAGTMRCSLPQRSLTGKLSISFSRIVPYFSLRTTATPVGRIRKPSLSPASQKILRTLRMARSSATRKLAIQPARSKSPRSAWSPKSSRSLLASTNLWPTAPASNGLIKTGLSACTAPAVTLRNWNYSKSFARANNFPCASMFPIS